MHTIQLTNVSDLLYGSKFMVYLSFISRYSLNIQGYIIFKKSYNFIYKTFITYYLKLINIQLILRITTFNNSIIIIIKFILLLSHKCDNHT